MSRDLVVVSLEAWDQVWRRNQHLLSWLMRGERDLRVLFVEPPVDPLHAARRGEVPRRGRGLRDGPDLPGVGTGRLWLLEGTKWLPRRLDRGQDERQAAAVVRTAARLGMERPILWVNAPSGAHVLRASGWPALYDITDDWLAADRTPTEHARLVADEAFLLARCGRVVVCSEDLRKRKAHAHPVLVANAVDLEPYGRPHPRPVDLPPGPIAVYVGTIHRDRFDVDLAVETARTLGDAASLVLVGPNLLGSSDTTSLRRAGAHLLGPRDFTAVPAYLVHADALLVPHLVNDFTESLDPIKVYEYLAAGRPVVSTPVAGFRTVGHSHVRSVAASGFAAAVRDTAQAGAEPDPGFDRAAVPSWQQRASQMRDVLDALAAQPG